MNYNPSVNIEFGIKDNFQYIVTPNAVSVLGNMIQGYQSGIHSFTIIGTYGTGKSSFLMAMEKDMIQGTSHLVSNSALFSESKNFEFLNIVGDYKPLSTLLAEKLEVCVNDDSKNIFHALDLYLKRLKAKNKLLFIVIDEFGKILEHAANNNPEKEFYFLQKLAEFVNVSTRNVILLTTLHQNFGAYAQKLTESQRNEWIKVKGRFKELVFAEPIEQLLYLAAEDLKECRHIANEAKEPFSELYSLSKKYKIVSDSLSFSTSKKLYPLDPVSASCLTIAIQRYGQNERTLFSFLSDRGEYSVKNYEPKLNETYNLSKVYDYVTYNFYTALSETNLDSTNWRAINVAIERIGSGIIAKNYIDSCLKIVKTIGLLNLFYGGIVVDRHFLSTYSKLTLGIKNFDVIIEKLESTKIIRYASYKKQYILFEGTDIDIEEELYKASSIVPYPQLSVSELEPFINQHICFAAATYYYTGTPRYFSYLISNEPKSTEPTGDLDGYINLIFPLSDIKDEVKDFSSKCDKAILFVYFDDTSSIIKHLHEIKKLQYLLENVVFEDRVAKLEITNQLNYERQMLNKVINTSIISDKKLTTWFFKGNEINIKSQNGLNKYLTHVCDIVYNKTPIIRNELFNKQKISSAISIARVNLLDAMLNHYQEEDFGFNKQNYPPEKTMYYTLFKNTGIHRQDKDGLWILGVPTNDDIRTLWDASVDFMEKSIERPRKLSELVKLLKSAPYKLKQGVIDVWIPCFLFIKQQEYALYNDGNFVLSITKEVFELLQKRINDFSIKAFNVSGVNLQLFNKYREFLNKEQGTSITINSLMDTIRPFFKFYKSLNEYAKHTSKFDNPSTEKFRNILANAKDPCKAFLEDIPAALGYNNLHNEEFLNQYLQLIKFSVHELVVCYDLFIDRIERSVIEQLGLPSEYSEYKAILDTRYKNINPNLLTKKNRTFLNRVLAPSASKKEFFEKLGAVIFDRKLESIKDSEEQLLISNLHHLFRELERYTAFDFINTEIDEIAFNFEIASSNGSFSKSQTYRLPKSKAKSAKKMEEKLNQLLSGDNDLDVCVLLKLLNEKLS